MNTPQSADSAAPLRGLGRLILRRREDLGLSQDDLARLCNVSQVTIVKWEHGSKPTYANLLVLSQVLDISIDTITEAMGYGGISLRERYGRAKRAIDDIPTLTGEERATITAILDQSLNRQR